MRRTLSLIPVLAIFFLGVLLHDVTAAQSTPDSCTVLVSPEGIRPLQAAIDAAPDGAVICARGGVYMETVRIPSSKSDLTLMAYPGEKPIIDGNYRLPGPEFDTLVRVNGRNIILDGLEIRHSTGRGLVVSVPSETVAIRNLSIHDNWNTGFLATGNMPATRSGTVTYVSDVTVENTDVFHNIRKAANAPYLVLGARPADTSDPAAWSFDVNAVWGAPYWSGRGVDLPTPYPEAISLQYDQAGALSRVFVSSGNAPLRYIGSAFSRTGAEITFDNRDVLSYDLALGKWVTYFDGSAYGIGPANGQSTAGIDAFELISPTVGLSETIDCPGCFPVLMSFSESVSAPGVGTVGPGDILQFTPTEVLTTTGQVRAGTFSLYRTASELGVGTANIDSLALLPDGRLVISTAASVTVGGAGTVSGDDLIAGDRGVWSLFFDASEAAGNPFRTLQTAASFDPAGNLVISGDPVGGSGLVFVAAQDSVARNNRVYRNFGEGLVLGRWSDRVTLEDNVAWDNDHASLYLNGTTFPTVQRNLVYCTDDHNFWDKSNNPLFRAPPGFILRDEDFEGVNPPTSRGQIIVNNTIIGCGTNFAVDAQPEEGSTIPRGGLRDAIVAHNTFVQARGDAGATQGVNNVQFTAKARYENSTFANNILLQNAVSGSLPSVTSGATSNLTIVPPFTVAGNLYNRSPFTSWFSSVTAYPESNRLVGDPMLANVVLPVKDQVVDPAWYLPGSGSSARDSALQIPGLVYNGLSRVPADPPDRGVDALVSPADRPGQIVIQIVNDPLEDTPISFSSSRLGAFTLTGLSDSYRRFEGLVPGVYDVTQALPAGWSLIGVSCSGSLPNDTTTISGSTTRIDLDPNEIVECFFNNYQRRGAITISAETDPDGAPASFTFDPSWSAANFNLTDGDSAASPPLLVGKHTVAPVNLPRGWSVTGATCSDGSDPTGPDGIILDPGEDVNCLFTFGLARGRIVIRQETVPAGIAQSFTYSPSWDTVPLVLANGESAESPALLPGDYAVTLTDPLGDWSLVSAACDDDNSSGPNGIVLDPGETVTCTLRHTYDLASRIVVATQTDPDGDSAVFDFASSWHPGFSLSDGQSLQSDLLTPGTYTVTEVNTPSGWSLSAVDCGGLDPNALALAPAVTVTCTFTNTLARGSITIVKQTDPDGDATAFEFDPSWSDANFTLTDNGSSHSGALLPGTYSVAEVNLPAGWSQTSATCSDGSDPASISLSPGEAVTCTFNNLRSPGSITIVKQTDPKGDTTPFEFDPSWSASNFTLTDGAQKSATSLEPGAYSVVELAAVGWTLVNATCSDGSPVSAIQLSAGESVTCTFTNQRQAAPVTELVFASANTNSSVDGGPSFSMIDILAQDRPGNVWSMKLQGASIGLTRNVNGLAILPDGSYLLTLARSQSVGSLGTVTPQDVIRYVGSSGGNPARVEWYLRGSRVGLGTGESIDALALAPDGRLLISTIGSLSVPCAINAATCPAGTLKGADEDLIAYTGTSGATSTGKWQLWFDGSKITGLGVEDVVGASVDASTGVIYISLLDAFTVGGLRGTAKTILSLTPSGASYRVALFSNWPDARFRSTVDAFEIRKP